MPTAIEQAYIDQGYILPDGFTWDLVSTERTKWQVDPIYVPVALAPGCVAWAVPYVDGKPMRRP